MRAFALVASLSILASPVAATSYAPPIMPSQAASHVGACMTVQGRASVSPDANRFGVNIGLDAPAESALFVAHLPSANAFPDLGRLDGQTVDITGVVHIDRGKATITLTNPELITVAGTEPAKLLTCDND